MGIKEETLTRFSQSAYCLITEGISISDVAVAHFPLFSGEVIARLVKEKNISEGANIAVKIKIEVLTKANKNKKNFWLDIHFISVLLLHVKSSCTVGR